MRPSISRPSLIVLLAVSAACGSKATGTDDAGTTSTSTDTTSGGTATTTTDTTTGDGGTTIVGASSLWYVDADGDGWGNADQVIEAVDRPDFAVDNSGDCDDLNASISPDATELCNGVDDNCDGLIDEDSADDAGTFYADSDGDGYGDPDLPTSACEASDGWVGNDSDCDDGDAAIYPGSFEATDDPATGFDGNCDGAVRCDDANCDGLVDLVYPSYWTATGGYGGAPDLVYYGDGGDFSATSPVDLASNQTWWSQAEDLNQDGYMDAVFVVPNDNGDDYVQSYVYWGSPSGFSDADRTALDTVGAVRVLLSDLDGDGWTDLVFSNEGQNSGFTRDSTIYWGSSAGYDVADATNLPTYGAWWAAADDLDADGYQDLVFCNYYDDTDGGGLETNSMVYWGSGSGFDSSNRTDLPTAGCRKVELHDLDGDGFSEVIFANSIDNSSDWKIDSTIYWNDAGTLTPANKTGLPTSYSFGMTSGDFDGDGDTDLVFANLYDESGYTGPNSLYWNTDGSFDSTDVSELDGDGVYGPQAADLNSDGFDDLVLPGSWSDTGGQQTISRVYWGSGSERLGDCIPTELPTDGPGYVAIGDMDRDGLPELVFPSGYGAGDGLIYWSSEDGYSEDNVTALGQSLGAWGPPLLLGDTDW